MASYDECLQHLIEMIAPRVKGDAELGADSDLVDELGLASLDVMELIEQVEDDFDLSFPLNALPDIRTVGDLARQLERLSA
jgi:acyl carrier protein